MLCQSEDLVSELQEEFVLDVRKASVATVEEAVSLRNRSKELRAKSKQLQVENRILNDYASSIAERAAEISINTILA